MYVIPIVIGALSTVTKGFVQSLRKCERGESIQTTTLLISAKILRRVMETWGGLAVTQTPVRNNRLMLVRKTLKRVKKKKKKFEKIKKGIELSNQESNRTLGWPNRLGPQNKPIASQWRGKTSPPPNKCPGYETKQSDGEALVMLELRGMQSTPLLPSLSGPLWPEMVAPDRILSMGQIELNCVPMLNLGKVWTPLFSLQLWVNSRTD